MGKGKSIWKYKLKIPSTKSKAQNKSQIQNSNFKIDSKFKIQNLRLGFKDIMTRWQSGDKAKSGELYYRAFGLRELKKLLREQGLKVLENYYSKDGEKAHWWNGKNIVTVGRKGVD
jgi:hypothetical protein